MEILKTEQDVIQLESEVVRGEVFLIYKPTESGVRYKRVDLFRLSMATEAFIDIAAYRTGSYLGAVVCLEHRVPVKQDLSWLYL